MAQSDRFRQSGGPIAVISFPRLHPVLSRPLQQLCSTLEPLTREQTQLHPSSHRHRWNTQQVVEHLVLTFEQTSANLNRRLSRRRPSRGYSSPSQVVLRFLVLTFGIYEPGTPALPEVTPPGDSSSPQTGKELAQRLMDAAANMDQLLVQCRRAFSIQPFAKHPVLGPLRVDQWRRFHSLHAQHHLHQIQEIFSPRLNRD